MNAGERILVVKLADIGDAVLALPAIQALQGRYPESRIDVLTTEAGGNVFRLSPAVSGVIKMAKQRFDHVRGLVSPSGLLDLAGFTLKLRRGRYTAVVLLHHLTTSFGTSKFRALVRATGSPVVAGLDNGRGDFLTHRAVDYGFGQRTEWEYGMDVAARLGADSTPRRPNLELTEETRLSARELLDGQVSGNRYALVHAEVGDYSPARAWPVERFADVARELFERHEMPVILVGVDRDLPGYRALEDLRGVISLVGRTTFPELCALVEGADLVVGCDSSVAHLAGAFDRPSATLFGPSNIGAWKPFGSGEHVIGAQLNGGASSVALHLDLPCSPCFYTGFRLGRPQGCSHRTCLNAMTSESVTGIVSDIASKLPGNRQV